MRLDRAVAEKQIADSRSQASDLIRRGLVILNNKVVRKPHTITSVKDDIRLVSKDLYVSRAGFKLASIASKFELDFSDKTILDVGSSTGGFTDYALQNRANKVFAVDVGTKQLHPKLRTNSRVDLHEKTDIRDFKLPDNNKLDYILVDVSFISITQLLNTLNNFASVNTKLVVMVKPQFETGQKHKGVVKNDSIRRQVLKDVEVELKKFFIVLNKKDSELSGAKGNVERFYLLAKIKR
jgi:23S rRNA (cytidine1920-2'-O)/16S rRNA (cytidine1409-2'-O)-methyltransferase